MANETAPDAVDASPEAKIDLRLAVEIPAKKLTPAAERALAEAAERRQAAASTFQKAKEITKEVNGPQDPEPTRYGDWERKGIVSDF